MQIIEEQMAQKTQQTVSSRLFLRMLAGLRMELREMVFPCDIDFNNPDDDLFSDLGSFFVEKGFLTEDFMPTPYALENDYIRVSSVSRNIESCPEQQSLLFTGPFLLHLAKQYHSTYPISPKQSPSDITDRFIN